MCTVTLRPTDGGYELFFNRDELRSRSPALPPSEAITRGVRYLAPTDTDAGGTWLAVNEAGISIGLLNSHPTGGPPRRETISRGRLVRDLADLAAVDELERRLSALELESFRPFTLLAVAPDDPAVVIDWDGVELSPGAAGAPFLLSSSSLDTEGAHAARRDLLTRLTRATPTSNEAHLEFHRSHLPARGPLAPCMHRDDARTVSFTLIEVDDSTASMSYAPGPPCRTRTGTAAVLRRAAAAGHHRAE